MSIKEYPINPAMLAFAQKSNSIAENYFSDRKNVTAIHKQLRKVDDFNNQLQQAREVDPEVAMRPMAV